MPLYWIAHRVNDQPRVFIADASAPIYARLAAAQAGFKGEFAEIHALDARMTRKVPKGMIGRELGEDEAKGLLGRMA